MLVPIKLSLCNLPCSTVPVPGTLGHNPHQLARFHATALHVMHYALSSSVCEYKSNRTVVYRYSTHIQMQVQGCEQ